MTAGNFGGSAKGRRHRLEVLNKSAIVLITAIWEAYCEDIAAEAIDHLIRHAPSASALPKELKKRVAKELKTNANELAIWSIADTGWKHTVKARLQKLTDERNWKFNTPKSFSIEELFLERLGVPALCNAWHWKGMTSARAKKKLDDYVTLRGAIAHRGKAASSCKKVAVEDYFDHVKRLAAKTGGRINKFIREVTGKRPW